MGRLGFEPRTIRLKAEYSTVELATQLTSLLIHLTSRSGYFTVQITRLLGEHLAERHSQKASY